MQEKMDDRKTPFTRRQFFCPTFVDEESRLPRLPTKDEYFQWIHGAGRKRCQVAPDDWVQKNKFDPLQLLVAREH